MSDSQPRTEHQDWLRDQEAEREIRALRAGINAALANEAFRSRTSPAARTILAEVEKRLEKDAAHIVAVWD